MYASLPSGSKKTSVMGNLIMITEADTCRKYVLSKLIQAVWDNEPNLFQMTVYKGDGSP
jgi:hypothetical protein